jgi:hypothetical protein
MPWPRQTTAPVDAVQIRQATPEVGGCGALVPAVAGTPVAAATARSAEEKGHAESNQQNRSDEVEHADGDEAKVLGDPEQTDDDERDGEDSHDVLRVEVKKIGTKA